VKPDVERLLTVPDAPPAAGPERELDPPPPLPGIPCPAAAVDVADGDGVVVEADVAAHPESPITAASEAAAIHPFLLDSSRLTFGRREFVGLFMMALLLFLFGNLFRECQPLQ
jgi:hypothetical protein